MDVGTTHYVLLVNNRLHFFSVTFCLIAESDKYFVFVNFAMQQHRNVQAAFVIHPIYGYNEDINIMLTNVLAFVMM